MPMLEIEDGASPKQNLSLQYEIKGDGPPLLMIGGTGWDLRQPPSMFERGLRRHFTVLRYDQRGQGQSGKPQQIYTMADYARDAARLLRALGWGQTAVLGISFGGMVAQHLALDFPQVMNKLVLACTSSGGAGGASYPLHEIQDLAPEEYARTFLQLANRRRDAAWQAANSQLWHSMLSEAIRARESMSEEDRQGLQRQLGARSGHDCWQRLPQIAPHLHGQVLVCGGSEDQICPPANLQALAAQIPGAQLQVFNGGHGFYMEDGQVLPAVIRFLQAAH